MTTTLTESQRNYIKQYETEMTEEEKANRDNAFLYEVCKSVERVQMKLEKMNPEEKASYIARLERFEGRMSII
jgi:hypothetical protein